MTSDPDWFARIMSVLAFGVSAATFMWSRRDKRRERIAAKQARLPTARTRWNPKIANDGFYTLMIGLRDVNRAIRFTEARLIRPRRGSIATWNGITRGLEGKKIPVSWEFTVLSNPAHGGDAATIALHFKPDGDIGNRIEVELAGRLNEGTLEPIKMRIAADIE
jgi:hypothetical protein